MRKLKNKVFLVIFGILSLFLISIIIFNNYQLYTREVNNVEDVLNRMRNMNQRIDKVPKPNIKPEGVASKENLENKIFMDSIVYTVLLNNNEIENIFCHTETKSNDEIVINIVNDILKEGKEYEVGNLYVADYSYYRTDDKITIVDNNVVKDRLLSNLSFSILILIILEVVSFTISWLLTTWIIKPVEESFTKQKQFVADASHELKTPLSVIIANVDMLEKDRENDKWFKNIKSEADSMNLLICNLLDLAKLEDDNNILNIELCNLSKLVEKTILPFESIIYEKKIKFDYDIQGGIECNCDKGKIQQLVSILVDNAIKHSKKNGKVFVKLESINQNIFLYIKNKGDGIKKGEEEKIFERFYRADGSRNRSENRYGLGLAIAKNIVELHNGSISAMQEKDYTVFKVELKKL